MSTPPARRSHAERSAATQAQVLEAAARVVLTKSFQAATMFEVAKEAGVTPGALQHHFGSKAELMLKLLERQLHAEGDEALAWPDAALPLQRRAQALLHTLWQGLYEQPRFLVAWGVYFGSVGDEVLRERIAELRARLQLTLHQHFLACLPELSQAADAPAFIDMVLSSLRGMAVVRLFETQAESSAAQRQALAQVIEQRCAAAASAHPKPSASKTAQARPAARKAAADQPSKSGKTVEATVPKPAPRSSRTPSPASSPKPAPKPVPRKTAP